MRDKRRLSADIGLWRGPSRETQQKWCKVLAGRIVDGVHSHSHVHMVRLMLEKQSLCLLKIIIRSVLGPGVQRLCKALDGIKPPFLGPHLTW